MSPDDASAAERMPPSYPPPADRVDPGAAHPAAEPGAADAGTAATPPAKPVRRSSWARETALVLVTALALSILIKTFLAQAFYIPSGSMEDTLAVGDRIMVSKLTPGPFEVERGDVVVFVDPGGWLEDAPADDRAGWQQALGDALTFVGLLPQDAGQHLVKRVIGVGGDAVACCGEDGRLTVNGHPLDEPYLKPGTEPSSMEFDVVVPDGHLWLMGDNRANSEDSRAHLGDPGGGMVATDRVVGRAFITLWPPERITLLRNPEDTFAEVPVRP